MCGRPKRRGAGLADPRGRFWRISTAGIFLPGRRRCGGSEHRRTRAGPRADRQHARRRRGRGHRFGWLFPQLFVAYYAQRRTRRLPVYMLGAFDRVACLAGVAGLLWLSFFVLWTIYSFVSGIVAVPYNDRKTLTTSWPRVLRQTWQGWRPAQSTARGGRIGCAREVEERCSSLRSRRHLKPYRDYRVNLRCESVIWPARRASTFRPCGTTSGKAFWRRRRGPPQGIAPTARSTSSGSISCACRSLDMPLTEIKRLIDLSGDASVSCDEVDALVRGHLQKVRAKRAALEALEARLSALSAQCASGQRVADCGILGELIHAAQSDK